MFHLLNLATQALCIVQSGCSIIVQWMNLNWILMLPYEVGRVFSFLVLQMKKTLKFVGFKCFSQVHIVTKLFNLGQEECFYFYKAHASLLRLDVFWRITYITLLDYQVFKLCFMGTRLKELNSKYSVKVIKRFCDFKENNT